MLCKIWGFHGDDYEKCRLLVYKIPVRTSQETHYVSATEPSRLMLSKIWSCHCGDYEKCRLLGYKSPVRTWQETHYISETAQPFHAMWDLKFSRWWLWRMPSSGTLRCMAFIKKERFGWSYNLNHQGDMNVRAINVSSNYQATHCEEILYYTILYYYYTVLHNTILYYTILYYTILYYTILYCTTLFFTILYHTILYYTTLYYIILHYIVFLRSILRLLVPANVVLISPILVSQIMEAITSSETSVLTRTTRHNIQEVDFLRSNKRLMKECISVTWKIVNILRNDNSDVHLNKQVRFIRPLLVSKHWAATVALSFMTD
jgi:hypothetical protein